ncbi:hypothetical protein AL515_03510 [Citrobacter sp. FDAARGOS_156]|uniref:hypothetical protein n=1 Tax=Citrobacter sp. FDAARGOS_156 TaxID=1702170 RepID=UPI00076B46D8|nr:hypothetical protein [Citrobacter sp. FDAARGOS_156]AMH12969.1 hypothetical protein AL515_03510 [Citrobacter sp. FDAARGOS_156]
MTTVNEITSAISWLWGVISSDELDHFLSVISSITTIAIALCGYRLAKDWLTERNRSSAHVAADNFFDELIDLPSMLMGFMMSVLRCAAFMSTIDDDVSLQQRNTEAQQRCLQLAENALMIKLRFFGYFARANKRGASINRPEHIEIEEALMQFGDDSFCLFRDVATHLITVNDFHGFKPVMQEFGGALREARRLSIAVNNAIRPVIGTSFSEYFSFPEEYITREEHR